MNKFNLINAGLLFRMNKWVGLHYIVVFAPNTGLWPSSNIREHARRIVSRQKSEHDKRLPEYTFNENI